MAVKTTQAVAAGVDGGTDFWVYPNAWDDLRVPLTSVKVGGVLAGKDEAFAATTIDEITVSVTENIQYKEQIDSFTDIPGTTSGGMKISDVIIARLYRKGNDAADTYDDPVFIFEFDIHFQADSNGTSAEFRGKPG